MGRLLLLIGAFCLFVTPAYAAGPSIVEADGHACMKDYKSRKRTEQAALLDAKRKATEFASTCIKSETNVKDLELKEDTLLAYSDAEVKTIRESGNSWYKDAASGDDCYRVTIRAKVIPGAETAERKYADHERRELCGTRAYQLFKDEYSTYKNGPVSRVGHRSHYNGRMNKCILYVEVIAAQDFYKKDDRLIDVTENRLLGTGTFIPGLGPMCFINGPDGVKGVSGADWLVFVRQMMQE